MNTDTPQPMDPERLAMLRLMVRRGNDPGDVSANLRRELLADRDRLAAELAEAETCILAERERGDDMRQQASVFRMDRDRLAAEAACLAKLIDQHLTMPLRSRSTMTVAEHYKILRSIRDFARSGGSMT